MTKSELVSEVARRVGIEKVTTLHIVDTAMEVIKETMCEGDHVFLRGFGSFVLKRRAEKMGRNITKNVTIKIPAHYIPSFKAAKPFAMAIKKSLKA